MAASVDIHDIGRHLHRGELVGEIAIAELPEVVGAPGMQGAGAVQGKGMHVSPEHLDNGFAGETAPGTRHGDVGLIGGAVAQLAVGVVTPRVQGAVVFDGVVSRVALTPGSDLGNT